MKVGTRQLKNQLSRYLREVRRGVTVYVTDRGRVVAEIRPVRDERGNERARLRELAARGDVELGSRPSEDFAPVRTSRGAKRLLQMLIEDRG